MRYSLLLVFGIQFLLAAQPAERMMTRQDYIAKFKDDAIEEMHRSGIPASITLAQGILESNNGNSPLARYARNHFGIKCHKTWSGPTFIQDDDTKDECFRKYNSAYESYKDHSEFLTTRSRYAFLFKLEKTDYKAWARGLKKAGYATNPKYAHLLIQIIESNQLYKYDRFPVIASRTVKNKKVAKDLAVSSSSLPVRHDLEMNNRIKCVYVKSGGTYYGISKQFGVEVSRLRKYNDKNKGDVLKVSEVVYLQPKKGKSRTKIHSVRGGETMWEISQKYGIRLKKLYRRNRMVVGSDPNPGQKIYLRGRKPEVF